MSLTHEALVAAQFGPRARAYVESADHAKGADLERLAAIVAARPGGRILDLGCGGGHVSFTVAPHAAAVVAYDLSADMLAAVRGVAAERGIAGIETRQGTAEALPFDDASFDIVATRFSAHHWSDVAVALAGMRRVLKPGGLAIVMDTVSPGIPEHDGFLHVAEVLRDPSHVCNYTPEQWSEALRVAGLRPAAPLLSRLRLDFAAWTARIGTPDVQSRAIRGLQKLMPAEVATHFAVELDGSFTIDTMMIEAER